MLMNKKRGFLKSPLAAKVSGEYRARTDDLLAASQTL